MMMCTIAADAAIRQRPHDRVAELGRLLPQHGELGRDAVEVRLQLRADAARLGLLPRERGRGVEHLDPPEVVIAGAPHQLVRDVEAVEAAGQDRPAERGPEVEEVVGLGAPLPRGCGCGRRSVRAGTAAVRTRGSAGWTVRRRRLIGRMACSFAGVYAGRCCRALVHREEHVAHDRRVRAPARRPLHLRSLDRRQPRPRHLRQRDPRATRSGRLRAPPRRDRRVRRELPRRRSRAARFVGRRARADPQAVPARARQHRASRCRWPRPISSRTRCSRKARSRRTIPRCADGRSRRRSTRSTWASSSARRST